ncbi:MAG: protein kinase [archaeon]|nr:protein kinase [archaeon]
MGNQIACPCHCGEDTQYLTPGQPLPTDDLAPLTATQDSEELTLRHNLNTTNSNNPYAPMKKPTQRPTDDYNDKYIILGDLGKGSLGNVKKAKSKDGKYIRAMKIISKEGIKEETNFSEIQTELNVLKVFDDKNIVKLIEYYETEDNFYIIQEYCNKGNCRQNKYDEFISYPEFMVKFIMQKVFSAVNFLHSMKFTHGDIKAENIMLNLPDDICADTPSFQEIAEKLNRKNLLLKELSNPNATEFSEEAKSILDTIKKYEIKVSDFGYSMIFNNSRMITPLNKTKCYYSPELTNGELTLESDEWACGILIYYLLSGKIPFKGKTDEELFSEIRNIKDNKNISELKGVSKDCINLIKELLNPDPNKRLKAKDALEHPFFSGSAYEYITTDKITATAPKSRQSANSSKRKKNGNPFKDNLIAFIVLKYMNKKEISALKRVFSRIQRGDPYAKVSKKDFIKIFKENMNKCSDEEIEEIFNKIDINKNNSVDIHELLKALSDLKSLLTENVLRNAYDLFDKDKSNAVSWNEINEIVFSGESIGDEFMSEFLQQIGKKKEDEISFEEFCELIKN